MNSQLTDREFRLSIRVIMVEIEVGSFQTGPEPFPMPFRGKVNFFMARNGEPMFDMKPSNDEQGTF